MSTENGVYAYIHDGYTRSAYVAPRTRLYPAVRFLYRPMLAQGRSIVARAIMDTKDAAKTEEIAAKAVAKQVVSWNLVDHLGADVPIDVAHLLRLQPLLLNRLYMIAVLGDEGGDEDPGDAAPEPTAESELERILEGSPAPLVPAEAADAGNSPAG